MLPSARSVTRLSARGRSSVESQKSSAWRATSSSVQLRRELRLQRLLAVVHVGGRLADHLDVPQRVLERVRAEVEVVEPERLLEDRRVRLLGQREHGLAVVEHVVAPDLVGPVGEPVRVRGTAGGQQQRGRVRGAARDDDDVGRERLLRASRSTTTPVTAVPAAFVSSRSARAPVSSVTLRCASAGRTASTSASDFACTRHGKPSHVAQRTQRLLGRSASSSMTPQGAWNGCSPAAARSSESCWMRGSWLTAGCGYGALACGSVGSSPRAPCTW